MTLLQVNGASKRFGNLVAIDDVSLSIEPGELRAIIGPNGAGKTTFFNLVSGLFAPTTGAILFDGRDVTALSPERAGRAGHGAHLSDHRDLSRAFGRRTISASRSRSRPATV